MPLERLALIIFIVLAAAGATLWIGSLIFASFALPAPATLVAALPALLVGYVVWRMVAERLENKEDDHYDRIEH